MCVCERILHLCVVSFCISLWFVLCVCVCVCVRVCVCFPPLQHQHFLHYNQAFSNYRNGGECRNISTAEGTRGMNFIKTLSCSAGGLLGKCSAVPAVACRGRTAGQQIGIVSMTLITSGSQSRNLALCVLSSPF